MRLIDADKLIKYIKSISSDQKEFIDCVNEQPTAFDVDKISKELVKRKKIVNKKMNESADIKHPFRDALQGMSLEELKALNKKIRSI